MTKEEKDAIEYFKNRIDICLDNANDCEEMDFDEEATYLRKEAIKIETVLNLIQKQQAELEKKDKIIYLMANNILTFRADTIVPTTEEGIIEFFEKRAEEN